MLAGLVKPLRLATLAVWLGVFAVYGLTPTPTTVLRAGGGWCSDQGCKSCNNCQYCTSQPPNPPGGECWAFVRADTPATSARAITASTDSARMRLGTENLQIGGTNSAY